MTSTPPRHSPSNVDLTVERNVIQAHYELHRAQEQNTDQALAGWCRKWADPALDLIVRLRRSAQ